MYSAKIDGEPTTFGTSGMLYRSNKLMYDRKTNTLWSSLLGEPVIGELAQRDLKLDFLPVELTTWSEWLNEHPETEVLSLDTGYYSPSMYRPETDSGSIYYDYRVNAETMFPVWLRDDRLDPKDEVLGFSSDNSHKAYPVMTLRKLRVVNDRVGEQDIVIVSSGDSSGVRVYESRGQAFRLPPNAKDARGYPTLLVDQEGNGWSVAPDALKTATAELPDLRRLPSHLTFWFGWYAFHPDTGLFESR